MIRSWVGRAVLIATWTALYPVWTSLSRNKLRTHIWECVRCVTVGCWMVRYKLGASITDTVIGSDLYSLMTIILMGLFKFESDNVILTPCRTLQQSSSQVELGTKNINPLTSQWTQNQEPIFLPHVLSKNSTKNKTTTKRKIHSVYRETGFTYKSVEPLRVLGARWEQLKAPCRTALLP